mmetsp:Transcript_36400/g.116603  ORF Transcript_36400/g.116603 Transcript_36400/m.116603 type:complete len:425 (-) Transcript_36400:478-1752(-)
MAVDYWLCPPCRQRDLDRHHRLLHHAYGADRSVCRHDDRLHPPHLRHRLRYQAGGTQPMGSCVRPSHPGGAGPLRDPPRAARCDPRLCLWSPRRRLARGAPLFLSLRAAGGRCRGLHRRLAGPPLPLHTPPPRSRPPARRRSPPRPLAPLPGRARALGRDRGGVGGCGSSRDRAAHGGDRRRRAGLSGGDDWHLPGVGHVRNGHAGRAEAGVKGGDHFLPRPLPLGRGWMGRANHVGRLCAAALLGAAAAVAPEQGPRGRKGVLLRARVPVAPHRHEPARRRHLLRRVHLPPRGGAIRRRGHSRRDRRTRRSLPHQPRRRGRGEPRPAQHSPHRRAGRLFYARPAGTRAQRQRRAPVAARPAWTSLRGGCLHRSAFAVSCASRGGGPQRRGGRWRRATLASSPCHRRKGARVDAADGLGPRGRL